MKIFKKFRLTLSSEMTVEHYNDSMALAIQYVESFYQQEVIKAEQID